MDSAVVMKSSGPARAMPWLVSRAQAVRLRRLRHDASCRASRRARCCGSSAWRPAARSS